MKISNLERKDIETCAFLMKVLQAAKYEVGGADIKDMHDCYQWVQKLSHAVAEGWNDENMPKAEPPKGVDAPRNVKVSNPAGKI